MKRLWRIVGRLLGLLALGALVVALALTFGGLQKEAKPAPQVSQLPVETPTQLPYPPPATSTPSGPPATPTVAPLPVPRCTFAARSVPAAPGPSLDAYHFSEPQVVLTHTSAIGIAGWLPDTRRLLITQDIPDTNRQTIETFNSRTGELRVYAEREQIGEKPVWIPALKGVAYTSVADKQGELWFSRDKPVQSQRLATGLSNLFLAAVPQGQQVLYLVGKQPQRLNPLTMDRQIVGVNLSRWEYPVTLEPGKFKGMYRIAWRPGTSQVAFYNNVYFFLVDVERGQVCRIDLGAEGNFHHWAILARWSPNGRYLALLTTVGVPPVKSVDLMILDTAIGELRSMRPEQYINPGQYYVTDMAWVPDSQIIAIRVAVEEKEGVLYEGLYLVKVADGQNKHVLSQTMFTGGNAGWSLAWSPDGRQLAVNCPTKTEGRLCLITVANRQ